MNVSVPQRHRKQIRSTTMLGRVNQEIKRGTRLLHLSKRAGVYELVWLPSMIELNQDWISAFLSME